MSPVRFNVDRGLLDLRSTTDIFPKSIFVTFRQPYLKNIVKDYN